MFELATIICDEFLEPFCVLELVRSSMEKCLVYYICIVCTCYNLCLISVIFQLVSAPNSVLYISGVSFKLAIDNTLVPLLSGYGQH